VSPPMKQFMKQEFGLAARVISCPYSRQNTRRLPTIISCSEHVFPRPKDWPAHVHSSGYWFLEEEAGWQPSADLLRFLEQRPPPVYIGFGSVGEPGLAEQTTAIVIEALRRSGQRGVLATGWSGLANLPEPPKNVFILESAPHAWLFPRMAAVVHHGGAGTTAAGLRAGVPGVIIPSGVDQFAWGRRVYELGAGARPIPRKKLTAEKLSQAIDFALTAPVQQAARELGMKIQAENGAQAAAQVIVDCLEPDRAV
jgi:sterol 3beta-glucosyltransferase